MKCLSFQHDDSLGLWEMLFFSVKTFAALLILYPVRNLAAVIPEKHAQATTPFTKTFPSLVGTPPSITGTFSPRLSKMKRFSKRDVILTRAILATWEYWCPVSGSQTKYFKWYATADIPHSSVTIFPWLNIEKFTEMKIVRKDFSAFFLHGVCIQRGKLACSYAFRGKTAGWVDSYGIHMGHLTHSTDSAENPKVSETCIDVSGPAHTCPAIEPQAVKCEVTSATGVYVDPPEAGTQLEPDAANHWSVVE